MIKAVTDYFSEFKVLKSASKDFWLTNAIVFFDGLAYFSMIIVLTIYLTKNCGFNDVDSGKWVGIYTLYITAFVFAVGSICDVIGIKKSFFIGIALIALSRLGLGLSPTILQGDDLKLAVQGSLIILSLGTAFMGPVTMTALRRFTSKENRATGFNVYYLLMNIGAILAGLVVLDGLRKSFGDVNGNLAIFDFGFVMAIICFICVIFLDENNFAEESERVENGAESKRPLAIFMEVWKESAFQKLILFLVLTIGVRLVFTHQFLVMPKYYTRVLYSNFELGAANSINPAIIVVGLILLIPIINRFSTIRLIIVGMSISALSLVLLALPIEWVMSLPWINNLTEAYFFIIIAQILIFALGELIFSPRFTEYIASIAPQDRVTSYMALSSLPMFIAKPINGFVSGLLISKYCYDGIRPKIETGNIPYSESPEFMWLIYLLLAIVSPIAVILLKNFITQNNSKPSDAKGDSHE